MLKHLKIGYLDSPTETLRCHYSWDAEERKLVVGYVGPHIEKF